MSKVKVNIGGRIIEATDKGSATEEEERELFGERTPEEVAEEIREATDVKRGRGRPVKAPRDRASAHKTVRLTPVLDERLREYAAAHDASESDVLRDALEEFLAHR